MDRNKTITLHVEADFIVQCKKGGLITESTKGCQMPIPLKVGKLN